MKRASSFGALFFFVVNSFLACGLLACGGSGGQGGELEPPELHAKPASMLRRSFPEQGPRGQEGCYAQRNSPTLRRAPMPL
jgi:hypothetical protein